MDQQAIIETNILPETQAVFSCPSLQELHSPGISLHSDKALFGNKKLKRFIKVQLIFFLVSSHHSAMVQNSRVKVM